MARHDGPKRPSGRAPNWLRCCLLHCCRPAEQYAPWFATVVKSAQVALAVLGMLSEEARASRLSFTDVIKRLASLPQNSPAFISRKVSSILDRMDAYR